MKIEINTEQNIKYKKESEYAKKEIEKRKKEIIKMSKETVRPHLA